MVLLLEDNRDVIEIEATYEDTDLVPYEPLSACSCFYLREIQVSRFNRLVEAIVKLIKERSK